MHINAYMKGWGWFHIDVKKGLYWQSRRKERGDRAWQGACVHFYGAYVSISLCLIKVIYQDSI